MSAAVAVQSQDRQVQQTDQKLQYHHQGHGPSVTGASPKSNRGSDSADKEDGQEQDNDDEEAWSGEDSNIDDASRKRKRQKRPISVSCELCKARKVKCDRGQPTCGWCTRNNQMCEYRERKKPGLRAGYGRELESRLDKLEGVLQSQQQLLQQLAANLPANQQHSIDHASPHSITGHSQGQPGPSNYLQRQSPYPAGSHTSSPTYAVHREDDHMPPPQLMPQPLQQPSHMMAMSLPTGGTSSDGYETTNPPLQSPSLNIPGTSGTAHHGPMAPARDGDMPPYDLLYALVDLYFKHINTWCPILHRRSTLDILFGSAGLEEADRILLHAIVATTLRFSTDARLNEHSRQHYHSKSKQKVLLYGLDNSSVKALQALVILALDLVGSSNGPPGWNLLALLTRGVVQLGLAVETTSMSINPLYPSIYTLRAMVLPEPRDFIEDESRRRLFWMVYLLDRYATISTAFEFALDDKEIDRKLPCRDEVFARNQPVETRFFMTSERSAFGEDKAENLGSFSYYVEILGILSRVHRFLKKPVDIGALPDVEQWQREYRELDSVLNSWKFSLPNEYGSTSRLCSTSINNSSNRTVNCMWVMLHITYHTVVIRLHSSAAYPTTRSPIFTPSFSAGKRCLNAVEDICQICTYVRNNNMQSNLGPPFAFSLWVAARLLLVHGSTIDHEVNPAIHALVDTLRELGAYWKVAERYATLLQRVLDEYSESEPSISGERLTPSTVRILADMRRTAYDLDFLISRQPRNFPTSQLKGTSITPARTPAPNELEYLDVFDFFNLPRLPMSADPTAHHAGNALGIANGGEDGSGIVIPDLGPNNEFNITNFMYDANSDWFTRSGTQGEL